MYIAYSAILKPFIPALSCSRLPKRSILATYQALFNSTLVQSRTKVKDATTISPEKMQRNATASGLSKDEAIRYPSVQITHGGRLSAPITVPRLLSLIDRRGYYVQLVSQRPPIVKIVDKSEEYNRKRQEQDQAKLAKAKQARKEVHLTWATGEADAAHKLEKVREDLGRGVRVDLAFTHKRGQPVPSEHEMSSKVQAVVDSLADVSKEWKERQSQRKMVAVFLQGIGVGTSHAQQQKPDTQNETSSVVTKKRKYNVAPIPQEIWNLFP